MHRASHAFIGVCVIYSTREHKSQKHTDDEFESYSDYRCRYYLPIISDYHPMTKQLLSLSYPWSSVAFFIDKIACWEISDVLRRFRKIAKSAC